MKKVIALGFLVLTFAVSAGINLFIETPSDLEQVMRPPSLDHWLGTDSIGRDVLVRVLQGYGTSLSVGGLGLFIAMALGFLLGGTAGWLGGWFDLLILRFTDFVDGLPDLLLAIAMLLIFHSVIEIESTGLSVLLLAMALGLVGWPRMVRQTRALVLTERSRGYATAALVTGADDWRILSKHLWPNIRRPMVRFGLMHFPMYVLFEGSLSFFGLGLKQPATSLGLLLQEGWRTISIAPNLVGAPALFLFLTLLAFETLRRDEPSLEL